MGLFDSLKNQAKGAVRNAVQSMGNKTEDIVFPTVPDSFAGFTVLPQAAMATPFQTAAMTVVALCVYPHSPDASIQMLNFLRGPRPLNGQEISFIRDRFRAKDYVPRSYFSGATPQNDYTPSSPTPSGSLRITTAFSPRGWPNCSSPPAVQTAPGPSSCGRRRTENGICGSSSSSPISGSRRAPTPGLKPWRSEK